MVLKREDIRKSLIQVLSLVFPAAVLSLIFATFFVLANYLTPCVFAYASALLLYEPHNFLLRQLKKLDELASSFRSAYGCSSTVVAIFACGIGLWITLRSVLTAMSSWIVCASVAVLLVYIATADRNTLASLICTVGFVLLLVASLVGIGGLLYRDILFIKTSLEPLMEPKGAIHDLLFDRGHSEIYAFLVNTMDRIGVDVEDHLSRWEDYLRMFATAAAAQSTLVADYLYRFGYGFVDWLFSLFLFVPTLHALLQFKEKWVNIVFLVSPLTQEDTSNLMVRIKSSIVKVFTAYYLLGVSNMIGTFIAFYVTGLPAPYVFSILSGLLSTIPVLSNWVIWIPACVYLIHGCHYGSAIIMAVVHLIVLGTISNKLYYFMGGYPFVLSLAIYLCVWNLGFIGVLVGPTLVILLPEMFSLVQSYLDDDGDEEEEEEKEKEGDRDGNQDEDKTM